MNIFKVSIFRMVFLRLLLILLLVGLLPFVQPIETFACSCLPPEPPLEALEESAAVFVGEVVSISDTEPTHGSYSGDVAVEFSVTTVWKGPVGKTIQIRTPWGGAACGYRFSEGIQYLVYAYAYGALESRDFRTSLCSRTRPLSSATETDLVELGEGRKPTPATPTVTPEASENEAIWGCRQSPGSADLPIVGLMVGIAWFGLRKRRPDGR